jgi:hypothetical protein
LLGSLPTLKKEVICSSEMLSCLKTRWYISQKKVSTLQALWIVGTRVLQTSHSWLTIASEGYHYQHLGEHNIYGLDGNIREICQRGEIWRMLMHRT